MTTKHNGVAPVSSVKDEPRLSSRIIRWPTVHQRTGLSRTTIWRKIQAKTFPAPIRLTDHAVGWRESEVEAWQAALASKGPRA